MKNIPLYTSTMLALLLWASSARAQLNAELLHQLVQHSKDEHDRQQTARNKQAVTTSNEQVNMNKTRELKQGYQVLHDRFKTIGEALQVLSLGVDIAPLVAKIARHQEHIISIAKDKPFLLPVALAAQQESARKATQLARYLTGLFIVMGDLNQMKQSDRRMLYSYALDELRALSALTGSLSRAMYQASLENQKGTMSAFSDFINQDTPIARDILKELKELEY